MNGGNLNQSQLSGLILANTGSSIGGGTGASNQISFDTNLNLSSLIDGQVRINTATGGAPKTSIFDANGNLQTNNLLAGYNSVTASGGTTVLTAASAYYQRLGGSTTQTFQLPNATTCVLGQAFVFDNDSSGVLTVTDNASNVVDTVPSGGYGYFFVESNSTSAGSWGKYALLPASYDFSTSTANFGSATITNATYQGNTIASGYGGTGLTTFTAANNALYSTSAGALTAGTLPVAAGGTGLSSTPSNGALDIGNGTGFTRTTLTAGTGISVTNTSGGITITNTSPSSGGTVTSVTGTAPVVSSGGNTPAISMAAATGSVNGYLTSTDWTTFNGKQAALVSGTNIKTVNSTTLLGSGDISVGVTSVTGTAPVVSSGGATPAISMAAATTSVSGYLTSTDWNTFNGKYSTGGALGTPSSGTLTNCTGYTYANLSGTVPTWNQNTTGNAATVSSITGNTGLMVDRLTPTSFIDGLTTSNFRSTYFGTTTYAAAIATTRWNTTPTAFNYALTSYGTSIGWACSDTQGFVATNYSTAGVIIGGGNANNILWNNAVPLYDKNWYSGALYGSILYDTNNTGYYVDPASTSVFNQINPANIYFTTANPTFNASSYFTASGGAYFSSGTVYCEANIKARGGVGNDTGSALVLTGGTGGYTQINGSARSPIFYDLDDTSWYCDPNSQSRFNKVTMPSNVGSGTFPMEISSVDRGIIFGNSSGSGIPCYFTVNSGGTVSGYIVASGGSTSYITSSDARLKTLIAPTTDTSVIDNTVINDFTWNADGKVDRGVFAQDAYKVKPSAITKGIDKEDGTIEIPWGVDYAKYVPDLIVYCQTLKQTISQLEARIAILESK